MLVAVMKQGIRTGLPGGAVLGLVFLLAGCMGTGSEEDLPSPSSGVEREIHGFTLTETERGQKLWELKSELAYRIPHQKSVLLENVELLFFDPDGNVSSRLTSLRGSVDEETGLLSAKDRVRVVTAEAETLTTEELIYDKDADRILGPGFVRLTQTDQVLTGYEFEARPDLTDYEVHRDVNITVIDRDGIVPDEP